MFTSPALASVGLTETGTRDAGHEVKTRTFPFAWSVKGKAIGDTQGKIKVDVDADSEEILGFHILGPDGDNLIHETVVAMYNHGTVEPISKSIHVHPALSEAVKKRRQSGGLDLGGKSHSGRLVGTNCAIDRAHPSRRWARDRLGSIGFLSRPGSEQPHLWKASATVRFQKEGAHYQ